MLRLTYLPANVAYVFTFGDAVLHLGDGPLFHDSRADAVDAAARCDLTVRPDGTVVASDVGGIPEVVVDGRTGTLVHYDEADPRGFEAALARALTAALSDPARAADMGRAGRERAVAEFGWDAIARRTLEVYRSVLR